jgi:hypothetical protein
VCSLSSMLASCVCENEIKMCRSCQEEAEESAKDIATDAKNTISMSSDGEL